MRIEAADERLVIVADDGSQSGVLLPSEEEFLHRQQWFRVRFERNEAGAVSTMRYGAFEAHKVAE